MKQKTLLLALCLFSLQCFAQKFNSENKLLTETYVPVTAENSKGKSTAFYISSSEISNKQYREFLKDLSKNKKTEALKIAAVDSTKWKNFMEFGANKPFVDYYFQDKTYDEFPVVNISKRGAEMYCEWLTEKYNSKAKHKIKFALPTEAQWILAAKGGDAKAVYPWQGNSVTYDKKGKWYGENMCNYRVKKKADEKAINSKGVDITAVVGSYFPNNFGIYNMSGNVAELVVDKEITKGGSWNSNADKVTIQSFEDYTTSPVPSPVVGFRPVMLVQ